MNEEKLVALIKSLEPYAENNSGHYRLRVALLAALGYLYLLVLVLGLLGIVALVLFSGHWNFITLKILWIPLVLVGLVLRSLWITIPEPEGKELKREQAPALFDLVDEIRSALVGPKVDHIFVSDAFNAGIVQIPRFGMFGMPINYLEVGLPLLRALTPEEFRSVLAHEFGHLSGKHGKFSGWIYRLRQSWLQILGTVKQERSYASFLFEPFLKWYAPYLNAYSFVLARQQEREADVYAVELAGSEVFALTLARIMAKERGLIEDFWPTFFRQSRIEAQPPRNPFEQMLGGIDQSIARGRAEKWFVQALQVQTGYDDTHPSLADRLAAMGVATEAEQNLVAEALMQACEQSSSAASFFIKDLPEDFLAGANRVWRENMLQNWREQHKQTQNSKARLSELEEQAKSRSLTLEELSELAGLIAATKELIDTIPILREILDLDPNHSNANFALGTILLEQKDHAGVAYLETAMSSDSSITGDACELLYEFYFDTGQKELAKDFRTRARQAYEKQIKRNEEAVNFTLRDRFEPHLLDAKVIHELNGELAKVRGLSTAYLVRKVFDDGDSILVLGIVAAFTWRNGINDKHSGVVLSEVVERAKVPGPTVFLSLDSEHYFLLDKFSRVVDSHVFTSDDTPNVGVKHFT